MAKHALAPRRAPSVSKSKYEALESRLVRAGQKTRAVASKRENGIIAIGAGVALGVMAKKGKNLPTVGGIDPALLYGAALFIAGPELLKGKNGERLGALGQGMLTVAAFNVPQRGIKVAGDDDDDDD